MAISGVKNTARAYYSGVTAQKQNALSKGASEYLTRLKETFSTLNITVASFSNSRQLESYARSTGKGSQNVAISAELLERVASGEVSAEELESYLADYEKSSSSLSSYANDNGYDLLSNGIALGKEGEATYWGFISAREKTKSGGRGNSVINSSSMNGLINALSAKEEDPLSPDVSEFLTYDQTGTVTSASMGQMNTNSGKTSDKSGELTRRLVSAIHQLEINKIISEASKELVQLRVSAANADQKDAQSINVIARRLEKLIRRAHRKIRDLNSEDIMQSQQRRAEVQDKKELAEKIKRELRKKIRDRKKREQEYLREKKDEDDNGFGAVSNSGKLTDAATEAQIAARAMAIAEAEIAQATASGGGTTGGGDGGAAAAPSGGEASGGEGEDGGGEVSEGAPVE